MMCVLLMIFELSLLLNEYFIYSWFSDLSPLIVWKTARCFKDLMLRVRRMFASLPHNTIYNVASISLLIASAVPLWYGRKIVKAKAEKGKS